MLRLEARQRREGADLALADRVADREQAGVDHADRHRRRRPPRPPRAPGRTAAAAAPGGPCRCRRGCQTSMSRAKRPRADAQEGDAVAVARVHVRLDLEDEAGELGVVRRDDRPSEVACGPGGGASSTNASRKSSTPKLVSALPKQTGVSSPGQHAVEVEAAPARSSSSTSSRSVAARSGAEQRRRGSGRRASATRTGARCRRRARSARRGGRLRVCGRRRPRKSGPSPIGQLSGHGLHARASARSRRADRAGAWPGGRAC